MKDARQERLARSQRDFHRDHAWPLTPGGLYVFHRYDGEAPDALSWWDDVGFVLNRRRVMVWWRHPRAVYRDAIEERARVLAGEPPDDDWMIEGWTPHYRKVGRSRKKIASYTCRMPSEAQSGYYERLRMLEQTLLAQGVDDVVWPAARRERLAWATGLDLVAPLEVRNAHELVAVADLARRLLLGQTRPEDEFPGYAYGRQPWLSEAAARAGRAWPPISPHT